jgi:hypothetical protein
LANLEAKSALFRCFVTQSDKFAYRDDAKSSVARCLKDLRQGLNATRRISDSIVKYYDCPRHEILFNQSGGGNFKKVKTRTVGAEKLKYSISFVPTT